MLSLVHPSYVREAYMLKFLKDHEINYSTALILCVVIVACAALVITGKAPIAAFVTMATTIVAAFTQPVAQKKPDALPEVKNEDGV